MPTAERRVAMPVTSSVARQIDDWSRSGRSGDRRREPDTYSPWTCESCRMHVLGKIFGGHGDLESSFRELESGAQAQDCSVLASA